MYNIGHKRAIPTHLKKGGLPPVTALEWMRLAEDAPISGYARSALKIIVDSANKNVCEGKWIAFPTEAELARRIGCSERHVRRLIDEIEDAGYVQGDHYLTDDYRLTSHKKNAREQWNRRAYEINEAAFKEAFLLSKDERKERQHIKLQNRNAQKGQTSKQQRDRGTQCPTGAAARRGTESAESVGQTCTEPQDIQSASRGTQCPTTVLSPTVLTETDLITTDVRAREDDDIQRNEENRRNNEEPQPSKAFSSDSASSGERSKSFSGASRSQTSPPPPLPPRAKCATDGCTQYAVGDEGLCQKHVMPIWKQRHEERFVEASCSHPGCPMKWKVLPDQLSDVMLCGVHNAERRRKESQERKREREAILRGVA